MKYIRRYKNPKLIINQRKRSRLFSEMKRREVPEIFREAARQGYDKKRLRLLDMLGRRCSNPDCLVPGGCTEIRALQLDHINGGGTQELKVFRGATTLYTYYILHPDVAKQRLQILCANCNWIKRYKMKEHTKRIILRGIKRAKTKVIIDQFF